MLGRTPRRSCLVIAVTLLFVFQFASPVGRGAGWDIG